VICDNAYRLESLFMYQFISTTLRGRVIALFSIFLLGVFILTLFDWWTIVSIHQKLTISEYFEDMFNNILEARRYEKNFLFYHDQNGLKENVVYINKVFEISDNLKENIIEIVGKEDQLQFQNKLKNYKEMIESFSSGKEFSITEAQAEIIRSLGKDIVDFSESLLKIKRTRIHHALTQMLLLPFAFLGIFILLSLLIAQLLFKRIMKPLSLIRRTIDNVARGNLSPINYEEDGKDEISKLIYAFNRMANELESKQDQLVQSRKIAAIGTFTAGIAHELNNPINNIYLTAETLLDDYEDLSKPEGKELVLDVLNQAERAAGIIKNLLDFSRSETSFFTDLQLSGVIEKTLKLVKNQTLLSNIQVNVDLSTDIPLIYGNMRNLEQIFLNLLINAIQAMPSGGTITIKSFRESNQYLRIDIQDTGVGINPENLEHIFEPFYTTKGVGQGTGLGLAVTYALVKKHGGYVEVQSKINSGTTFSIYLPIDGRREKQQ